MAVGRAAGGSFAHPEPIATIAIRMLMRLLHAAVIGRLTGAITFGSDLLHIVGIGFDLFNALFELVE